MKLETQIREALGEELPVCAWCDKPIVAIIYRNHLDWKHADGNFGCGNGATVAVLLDPADNFFSEWDSLPAYYQRKGVESA